MYVCSVCIVLQNLFSRPKACSVLATYMLKCQLPWHAGVLANGSLLGINESLGGLSLNGNQLGAGVNDKSMSMGAVNGDSLGRGGLTSIGTNASSNPMAASLPIVQNMAQANGLPFGWMSLADPDGRMFYFNNLTGAAQWSPPMST